MHTAITFLECENMFNIISCLNHKQFIKVSHLTIVLQLFINIYFIIFGYANSYHFMENDFLFYLFQNEVQITLYVQ